jgi:hypothetical protein
MSAAWATLEALFVKRFHATVAFATVGGLSLAFYVLTQRSLLFLALYSGVASGVLWYLASSLMWDDARTRREAPPSTAQAALNAYAAVATGISAVMSACASLVGGDQTTFLQWLLM